MDRQADRQTDRQTDRLTDAQAQRNINTLKLANKWEKTDGKYEISIMTTKKFAKSVGKQLKESHKIDEIKGQFKSSK